MWAPSGDTFLSTWRTTSIDTRYSQVCGDESSSNLLGGGSQVPYVSSGGEDCASDTCHCGSGKGTEDTLR